MWYPVGSHMPGPITFKLSGIVGGSRETVLGHIRVGMNHDSGLMTLCCYLELQLSEVVGGGWESPHIG